MNLVDKLEKEFDAEKQRRENKIKFVNELVKKKIGKFLTDAKIEILRYSLPPEKLTYREIADRIFSVETTIKGYASDLWKLLSEILERKVKRSSVNEAIKSAMEEATGEPIEDSSSHKKEKMNLPPDNLNDECPEGSVPPGSTYYIERVDPNKKTITIESICYQQVLQPYALIKIKAPRLMGKTSLISRIKSVAEEKQFNVVEINLSTFATKSTLKELATFYQRFCAKVSQLLKLNTNIQEYWDRSFLGENDICSEIFTDSILASGERPLLLILDEINWLFPYEDIAVDFFALLRAWHEAGRHHPQWRKLRLVLAYSTEPSIKLPQEKSPFENVGTFINLPEFTVEQIENLANNRYSLKLSSTDIDSLMAMVGGHPYLIRMALYSLFKKTPNLEQLLQQAIYAEGIYGEHLQDLLRRLQEIPNLKNCYRDVVNNSGWVEINSMEANDLERLGLVMRKEGKVKARNNLYWQYFKRVLG